MTTETPKPAAKPAAPKPAAKPKGVAPVYALVRINGDVLPGEIIVPKSDAERTELVDVLKAARDLEPAELALFEKMSAVSADDDVLG